MCLLCVARITGNNGAILKVAESSHVTSFSLCLAGTCLEDLKEDYSTVNL